MTRRIAHAAQIGALVLALALVPAALAAKGGDGGGGATSSCTQVRPAPRSTTPGPGHRPARGACRASSSSTPSTSSTMTSAAARRPSRSGSPRRTDSPSRCRPSTITLNSASTGYVWAYVTSPTTAADGDYPLTVTVERAGSSSPAATSSYKVYSSDTVAPKLYWTNPSDGGALTGRTAYVGFASSDDHAVKQVDLYVDGVSEATNSATASRSSASCPTSGRSAASTGQHTATYTSTDWMGNVASQTATFTVN